MFDTTHLFQLSRLLRKQWRTNPAMAVASLVIDAYKRRSALSVQNADVALTTVDATYLRFMTKVKTDTCALYAHHRHTCA